MNTLKASLIYALHMAIPLRLAFWHIERMGEGTLRDLHRLFPPL